MEIEDFRTAKREMEDEMATAIHAAIRKFEERTGYTPENVSVTIVETTSMGADKKQYALGEVRTRVPI